MVKITPLGVLDDPTTTTTTATATTAGTTQSSTSTQRTAATVHSSSANSNVHDDVHTHGQGQCFSQGAPVVLEGPGAMCTLPACTLPVNELLHEYKVRIPLHRKRGVYAVCVCALCVYAFCVYAVCVCMTPSHPVVPYTQVTVCTANDQQSTSCGTICVDLHGEHAPSGQRVVSSHAAPSWLTRCGAVSHTLQV